MFKSYFSFLAPDASQILIPSLTPPRVEDATALIEVILEFMVSHSNSFDLFWSMFRTHYLTVFYPDVCKEVGILDRFSGTLPDSNPH